MQEIFQAAFMPINVVFTVMLILVVLYWLMVIIGAMDVDFLNFDFDADLDADADIDIDTDIDGDLDIEGGGAMRGLLHFFYVGEVPVMVLLSVLILTMWAFSMIANHYLNPTGSLPAAMPIFAANLFASLSVCKVIGMPLRRLFMVFDKDSNASRSVMGRICTVITTQVSDKLGQAEMPSKGAPILLNVVAEGGNIFHKGDEAVVIGKNKETGVYTIAPVDLEK